ncbi:MAG: hypothetical protein IAE78_07045 [Myxococcus sp.]|nr:hypothetical protein [Myxococcus sp.]
MNVLRSLARELFSLYGSDATRKTTGGEVGLRTALEKRVVPPVVNLSRYQDSFERLPQSVQGALHTLRGERAMAKASWAPLAMTGPMGASLGVAAAPAHQAHLSDGFDGSRRPPVDLSGGVKPPVVLPIETPAPRAAGANGFTASLDDLL